jgi:D-methionine transport system permease protein
MIELIQGAFSANTWNLVGPAVLSTLYMTVVTTILTGIGGLIIGIFLVIIRPDGLRPLPFVYNVFGGLINILRSLPSVILIVLTLPLSRLILGISYGPNAAIIALSCTCMPMFARLVEGGLLEVDRGKIEAAKSIGAKTGDIVRKVLLPEALPVLIRNFTVTVIAVISTTALAGSFGAGGVGDIAVRYGYHRFQASIMLASVLVLIVIVQVVQLLGEGSAKHILKKRHI